MQASAAPPVLVISEAPAALSNQRSFDFKFNAKASPAASIQFISCSLDNRPAQTCTAGFTVLDLMDGDHVLKVKAQDSLGNSSDEVVYLWKIDATRPIVTVNQQPAAVAGMTSVSFAFSSNEAASFLCALDAEAMTPCTSPVMQTVLEGAHTFKIQAVDMAKNSSDINTNAFKVDLTAPAINILTKPAVLIGANTASFTFSGTDDGMAISVFSCKLDNQAASACNAGSAKYTNLTEGAHTFSLSGQDSAGNMSAASTYTWSVDLTAPSVPVVTADVAANTKNAAASFMYSSADLNGIKSFDCQLDSGAVAVCANTGATYAALASGAHTFKVRATDAVGNVSAFKTFSWTVDLAAPVVALMQTPSNSTMATDASFTFSVTDQGSGVKSIECKLDGGAFAACTSPKIYAGLAIANHDFTVRARDQVDNLSAAVSFAWTIAAAPTPTPTPVPTATPNPTGGSDFIPKPGSLTGLTVSGPITLESGKTYTHLKITNPSGHCIIGNRVSNVRITNSEIGPCGDGTGEEQNGIQVDDSSNIRVDHSIIHDSATGFYAVRATGIVFDHNYIYKIRGPFPRGQIIQLDSVYGAGNKIYCNISANTSTDKTEDHINTWQSMGTASSPIEIAYNRITGGYSKNGTGVILGDGDGSQYIDVHDNTIVNVANAGISVAGGDHMKVRNNRIYNNGPFSSVGLSVRNFYKSCGDIQVSGNRVFAIDHIWGVNGPWHYLNTGECSNVQESNNILGDTTLVPAMIDEEYSECK